MVHRARQSNAVFCYIYAFFASCGVGWSAEPASGRVLLGFEADEISRIIAIPGAGAAQGRDQVVNRYDANRDGSVSVLDALLVINHLATQRDLSDAESPALARNSRLESPIDNELVRVLAEDAHQTGRQMKIR